MLYWVGRFILIAFFKVFCKIKYFDQDKIPTEGGFIIASNHVSYYDPFAVGSGLTKKIHFMAKKELFKNWLMRVFITIMASFPVDREKVDIGAIRESLKILKKGEVVGIFPEGKRSDDGTVGEGHGGAAMISLMSGAPITPAAMIGTLNARIKSGLIPKFKRIVIKYGDPIHPNDFKGNKKERISQITNKVIESIRRMKKELET